MKSRSVVHGDCLEVLKGFKASSVDLIYMDPPFNTGTIRAHGKSGAHYRDIFAWDADFNDLKVAVKSSDILGKLFAFEGASSTMAYLVFMARRLNECVRVLRDPGSLWVHRDWRVAHYLRLLIGDMLERGELVNEIIWCYTGPGSPKQRRFCRKHDVLLWFSASRAWTANMEAVRIPYSTETIERLSYGTTMSMVASDGKRIKADPRRGKVPESWWYVPPVKGNSAESVDYPTQKPLALLERIIKASSDEGDLVLDPFCGSGTTLVAAERLGRKWIGIDANVQACTVARTRFPHLPDY